MSYANSYPTLVKDYPDDTEYIILLENCYMSDSGYKEDNGSTRHNYLQVLTFLNTEALNTWVISHDASGYNSHEKYKVLKVKSCSVVKTIEIKIE